MSEKKTVCVHPCMDGLMNGWNHAWMHGCMDAHVTYIQADDPVYLQSLTEIRDTKQH